ncbi:MAG: DHA2 family efflux MFS transporter permease subunit [Nitrospinota bacterium]|nr:MAG: DHA2 family efflux MFS transporter permease subunit [Nitrospinota bacterium]
MSPSRPDRPVVQAPPANKWLVTLAVMFGAFLAVMDVSVVNVALPHMMGTFGETLSAITWVATSYSIAEIIMITMAGWWSTLLGRKRFFLASFALFTLSSVLAGTAQTFAQMIIYRIIQGFGGGSLIPVSQAILRETFPPEEQGMAMAVYGMGVVLAPAIGPVFGGWLTDHYGWPWIFYINVPFSIVGMLMVSAFVEDPPYLRRGIQRIDWFGILLLTIGLTVMQIVLERGEEENWFDSTWIVVGAVLTVVVLLGLIVWEFRVPEPVVNFRILRNLPLSVGSGIGLLFGIALFGTTFILPQFLQHLLGYTAYHAGLVLLPRAITLFLAMPLAGRLYNYIDPRLLVATGIGIIYWSYQDLAHLSLQVGFWNLIPPLFLMGIGMPFMFVTLTAVALSTVRREDMTAASSFYTLARRIGGNIGYALVATLVDRRSLFHRVRLIGRISPLNSVYLASQAGLMTRLLRQQVDPVAAQQKALALADTLVNRQATMLAYNDISWLMGVMFLVILPFLLLLPGKTGRQQAGKGG